MRPFFPQLFLFKPLCFMNFVYLYPTLFKFVLQHTFISFQIMDSSSTSTIYSDIELCTHCTPLGYQISDFISRNQTQTRRASETSISRPIKYKPCWRIRRNKHRTPENTAENKERNKFLQEQVQLLTLTTQFLHQKLQKHQHHAKDSS